MSYQVLIVEDEGVIALGMRMLLAADGFAVVDSVDSAAAAFRKIEKKKPDIVLMDIRLKGDMDGLEAASILRNRYDVPFIYVTAHANAEIVERARATEPSGYLVKPVSGETVKTAIILALQKATLTSVNGAAEKYATPSRATLLLVGDLPKIEPAVCELNLGEVVLLDTEEQPSKK